MKMKTSKLTAIAGSLLLISAYGHVANAAELVGQSLGAGNTVDVFNLTCATAAGAPTVSVAVSVNSTSGSPVTAIINRTPEESAVSLDSTVDGSFSFPGTKTPTPACTTLTNFLSALSKKKATCTNNGTYNIYVTKAGTDAATYDLRAQCMSGIDGAGPETSSTISAPIQNQ